MDNLPSHNLVNYDEKMDTTSFESLLYRPSDSYKYTFGHTLIIGGSPGMIGAPFLCAQAALRAGSGLATIASTAPVIDKLEHRVLEGTTLCLPPTEKMAFQILQDYIRERHVSVLVIGPGLSQTIQPIVMNIVHHIDLPLIVDGTALRFVAENPTVLKKRAGKVCVLTPHHGELQRFFSQPLPKDQIAVARLTTEIAERYRLVIAVKGNPTFTISPHHDPIENTSGGPALATAGSGDVLAGIIGAFLAQGLQPNSAVSSAVYIHGLAGDLAAHDLSEPAVIASDLIDYLPQAFQSIASTLGRIRKRHHPSADNKGADGCPNER